MSSPSRLYRALLKAHKKCLPREMCELGDTYVKAEFKLHKSATPEQAAGFMREWEAYLEQIQSPAHAQENDSVKIIYGADLPDSVELTDEQRMQMEKLWQEATKSGGE